MKPSDVKELKSLKELRQRYHDFILKNYELSAAEVRTEMGFYDMLQEHDIDYLGETFDMIDHGWVGPRYCRALTYVLVYFIMMICFSTVSLVGCVILSDKCPANLIQTTVYCSNSTGIYPPINGTCSSSSSTSSVSLYQGHKMPYCINTTSHTVSNGSSLIPFTEGVCGYVMVGSFGLTLVLFILGYIGAIIYTHYESTLVTQKTQLLYLGQYFDQ